MDLKGKGISWVGNIYHKFEAIRSEVEDISKETAKYVENQVQGVGVNVKEIYAGVMHDLILSSSLESIEEENSDLSVQNMSDLGTCKESMAALDDNASVPDKVSETTAPMVKDSTLLSFSTGVHNKKHLLSSSPVSLVEDGWPDFSLEQNEDTEDILRPPDSPVKDGWPDFSLEQNDDTEDILTKGNLSETSEINVPTVEYSSQASFLNGVYDRNDLFPSSSPEQGDTEDMLTKGNEIGTSEIVEITVPMVEDSSQNSFLNAVYDRNDEQNYDTEDILTKGNEIGTSEIVEIPVPMVEDTSQTSFSNDDTKDILTKGNESEISEIVEITVPTVDSSQTSFLNGVYDRNDLLPSSSASLVKDAGPEFLLEQNEEFEKLGKSKTDMEEVVVKKDPPQLGVSKVADPAVEVHKETFCQNGGYIHKETLDRTGHANDSSTALPSSMYVPSFSSENQVLETGSTPSSSFSIEPNGMGTLTTSEASKNEFEEYKDQDAFKSHAELGIQGGNTDGRAELDVCDEAIGMDKEAIDKFDNVKLEDSCIVVLSKEFFSVPIRKGHYRSYKDKIRDAFASRMRTGKKEEYELLAMWYADIDAGADLHRQESSIPCTLSRTLDSKSLPTDESCGSDWEIL